MADLAHSPSADIAAERCCGVLSMSDPSGHHRVAMRLPAAAVRLWVGGRAHAPAVQARLERLPVASGIHHLGGLRFAVLPFAGDPAPFDTAVAWCQQLVRAAQQEGGPAPQALVAPAEVRVGSGDPELVEDPLGVDLDRQPPQLEAGHVYCTAWAAKMLESGHQLTPGPSYEGPSGKSAPLVEVGPALLDTVPWRNPELLGRQLKTVERKEAFDRLRAALAGPGLRLEGPLGCGKTRLLWTVLERRESPRLWLRARPPRRGAPALPGQLARLLLTPSDRHLGDPLHPRFTDESERHRLHRELHARRQQNPERGVAEWAVEALDRLRPQGGEPIYLVCDDAEQLAPEDSVFLARLASADPVGERFRLVLCGRPRPADDDLLGALPTLATAAFGDGEMEAFADALFSGLSLPASVRERLLTATRGYPFTLEEGMIELIRDKEVRRIYGSFFFGGRDSADYRPSLRLVCHLEAEATRVGAATPIRFAAVAGLAAPVEELAAAAEIAGDRPPAAWHERALAAGLATAGQTPWGDGLAPACPAFAAALAHGIDEAGAARMSQTLGELLAARRSTGESSWAAYQLLRGSAAGVPPLLAALQSGFGKALPREEAIEALATELRRHREEGGDAGTELRLLWQLLPIARRLGRLHEFQAELARGVEMAVAEPRQLLALASVKAELEQEAGDFREAEATIQQALKTAKGADPRRQALLLMQLGRLFIRQGRYREAAELFGNLQESLDRQNLKPMAATCLFYLGNIAIHERRFDDAARHHESALEERRRQKLAGPAGLSLSALGSVSLSQGNYPQGLAYYKEANRLLSEHGKPADVSYTLIGLGRALTRLGDFTGASKHLRQALELRAGRDDVAGECIARLEVSKNYLYLGQPEPALEEARKAHFHLQLLSLPDPTADAETLLGRIRLSQRRTDEARRHLTTALEAHRRRGDDPDAALDLAWLIDIALAAEDADALRRHAIDLKALLDRVGPLEMAERLHLRMYRGLTSLREHGHKVVDPLPHLQTAYAELLRKAAHLRPEQRHRFLFQSEDNQAIVDAAARAGLAQEG